MEGLRLLLVALLFVQCGEDRGPGYLTGSVYGVVDSDVVKVQAFGWHSGDQVPITALRFQGGQALIFVGSDHPDGLELVLSWVDGEWIPIWPEEGAER